MQKLIIIKTLQQLEELSEYLSDKEYIALDTETTGTEKESQIICFSVCAEVGEVDIGYCVVLGYWDCLNQTLIWYETLEGARSFFQKLKDKKLIMQNAPFDCAMIENNFQVSLIEDVHTDTLPLGHLLNENRLNGLKERGVELFGEDAREEQRVMKASVLRNGGVLTKEKYELYKAGPELWDYAAKDAILTMNVWCHDVPILFEEKLDKFFYEDETMPLLRGPTYQMNTVGLKVDPEKLSKLKGELETQIMTLEADIYREIEQYTKEVYPKGFGKKPKHFNIGSREQLAWLLFEKLGNEFHMLTKTGQKMCKVLEVKRPYSNEAKRDFISLCESRKGEVWEMWEWDSKKKRMDKKVRKIPSPIKYMSVGKETCEKFSKRYKWVAKLVEHSQAKKLLNTYVCGIQKRMKYNIIRPSFLQSGTTSGRYSSKNPNFQNLPRGDKRIKACIISRPGKVFVGADFAQLEPRVFASQSQDNRLMECFKTGDDFYSVVGVPIFDLEGKSKSLKKEHPQGFAALFPDARQISKEDVALATPYGTTAYKMSASTGLPVAKCQEIIDAYFAAFPKVHQFMLDSHEMAKRDGVVYNMFGRPRRMPKAKKIPELFGDTPHGELEYAWRNILNLAINHRVQSTGASIVNRDAIAFCEACQQRGLEDPRWLEVYIVMQVHDELIVEGPEALKHDIAALLKYCMENTTKLPGVDLLAEPKIGYNLAELK